MDGVWGGADEDSAGVWTRSGYEALYGGGFSIHPQGERVVRDSDGLAGEWADGDTRAGCGA